MASNPIIEKLAGSVQTTNTTITNIITIPTVSDRAYLISGMICGHAAGTNQGMGVVLEACYRNDSGTVTEVGARTEFLLVRDDGVWTYNFLISTTNIILRVGGNTGDTIEWGAFVDIVVPQL